MAQHFSPSANSWLLGLIAAFVLVLAIACGALYALFSSGWRTGEDRAPGQPIPFSHAHHVGEAGIDCRYCHTSVEDSAFAGLPTSETCMNCHAHLFVDAPTLAPVRESFAMDRPIRWTRVHDLPDFVFFDHSVHIHKGVGCETCHGRVDRMPLIRVEVPLGMSWCVACHRDPGPRLRPLDQVFTMGWTPEGDPAALADQLVDRQHVRPQLSCSGCHR